MTSITAAPATAAVSDVPTGYADWVARAAPGARCVYHRGHLSADRLPITTRLGEAAQRQLDRSADLALAMAAAGQVLVVQHRLDDGFSYLAIKATRNTAPVSAALARANGRSA